MKKLILIAVFSFLVLAARAQVSEIDRMNFDIDYHADSSIVCNYTDKHNLIISYGHFTNTAAENGLIERTSFFLEDIGSGQLTHIVTLPLGYKVNDVNFVYLTRTDNGFSDVYCCFCGTHRKYIDMYAIFDSLMLRPQYYYVYDTLGFVGFFNMEEAVSPNISYSAKIRDVEGTKELYRMTCYAEYHGAYHPNQITYEDNAVLDCVGVPENTRNALSCMCRVKFYPIYTVSPSTPSGTRWDNNIRYETNNPREIMEDITRTNNYIVTASRHLGDDTTVWLRFSGKETSLVPNGMELNNNVKPLRISTLKINGELLTNRYYTVIDSPLRVCHVGGDVFAVSFYARNRMDNIEGILTFRYDIASNDTNIDGAFDIGTYGLNELIYLPQTNATATMQHVSGNHTNTTTFIFWNMLSGGYYASHRLITGNIILQSFCVFNTWIDRVLWSGINIEQLKPVYLLYQDIAPNNETVVSCQNRTDIELPRTEAKIRDDIYYFPIQERFDDDQIKYKINENHFNPYNPNRIEICKKK